MKNYKKTLAGLFSAMIVIGALPTNVSAATIGDTGCSYSMSSSYTSVSTTVSLAGGYSGTALVSVSARYKAGANLTSSGATTYVSTTSNNNTAGGVTASISLPATHDGKSYCYEVSSSHGGSVTRNNLRTSFGDNKFISRN